jgi:hypothetical protein
MRKTYISDELLRGFCAGLSTHFSPSQLCECELVWAAEDYPKRNVYIAEDEETQQLWAEHLRTRKMSDERSSDGKSRDCEVLDRTKLRYTVAEGEDIIFIDEDTRCFVALALEA